MRRFCKGMSSLAGMGLERSLVRTRRGVQVVLSGVPGGCLQWSAWIRPCRFASCTAEVIVRPDHHQTGCGGGWGSEGWAGARMGKRSSSELRDQATDLDRHRCPALLDEGVGGEYLRASSCSLCSSSMDRPSSTGQACVLEPVPRRAFREAANIEVRSGFALQLAALAQPVQQTGQGLKEMIRQRFGFLVASVGREA